VPAANNLLQKLIKELTRCRFALSNSKGREGSRECQDGYTRKRIGKQVMPTKRVVEFSNFGEHKRKRARMKNHASP
jgi:hypothetical protein